MDGPNVISYASQYTVTCVPDDPHWDIKVEYRGDHRWAVMHYSQCLGRDGTWSHESIPSERKEEWLADHRFPLAEALIRAQDQAPLVKVNGWTPAMWLTRENINPVVD